MRVFLLTLGFIAVSLPALACEWSKSAQSQQTPLPVASSDANQSTPETPPPPPPSAPPQG